MMELVLVTITATSLITSLLVLREVKALAVKKELPVMEAPSPASASSSAPTLNGSAPEEFQIAFPQPDPNNKYNWRTPKPYA